MLIEEPIAILTPFRRGTISLPTGSDISRICTKTSNCFITGEIKDKRAKIEHKIDKMMAEENASFEMIRQSIDVGGPSMSHNARKAFISTALITDPENYKDLIDELEKNNGAISLATRLVLAKKASKMITEYLLSVDKAIQNTEIQDLEKCYDIR